MKTCVLISRKSEPCPKAPGPGSAPPSGRAVAVRSTLSELRLNDSQTALALVCALDSLLAQTLSADALYLALSGAARECQRLGIPREVYQQVIQTVVRQWGLRFRQNPLSGLHR